MTDQEKMNAAKQFMTMFFSMLTIALPALAQSQQFTALTTAAMGAIPFFFACGSFAWSVYSHRGMKKVPDNATAVILPEGPEPVGKVIDLTPMTGLAKVVGVILLCLIAVPALAQTKRPALTGNPISDIENAAAKQLISSSTTSANSLTTMFQDVATFIGEDNADAIALATVVPALQDGNGQQCWIAMQAFALVFKAHPIPLTLKVASDLEALRLNQIAANKICTNSACTQVFADLTNTVAQVSPINILVPSLNQLCSKVPQIALTAPITPPVATPAPVPAATPEPVVTPAK